ncbi:MAG: hypothetical protein JXR40_03010 [Pontiellaceae bacterium]|nr:hypothetical protein [Pontiellaceae bacterium]
MTLTQYAGGFAAGIMCCMAMGCSTSFSISGDKSPVRVKSSGLVHSYAACNGIRPYDGTVLDAGIFGDNRWGEIASLDVWPIGGVWVSFIGARIKLLPFELGAGVFGYDPEPEEYLNNKVQEQDKEEDVPAPEK